MNELVNSIYQKIDFLRSANFAHARELAEFLFYVAGELEKPTRHESENIRLKKELERVLNALYECHDENQELKELIVKKELERMKVGK